MLVCSAHIRGYLSEMRHEEVKAEAGIGASQCFSPSSLSLLNPFSLGQASARELTTGSVSVVGNQKERKTKDYVISRGH